MAGVATLEWVRRGHEQQAAREADRLATLPAQPSPPPEELSMTDLAVKTPDETPIDEWMRRENERQAKKEAERRAAESDRYGRVKVSDRRYGGQGI